MIGIIVSGHGNFASGIVSTVTLIAGEQESLINVDFDGSKDLSSDLKAAVSNLNTEQVIIFTDLLGGAPFREAALLAEENANIQVVAGVNPQMLIEACLEREDYEDLVNDVIALIDNAKEGMTSLAKQKGNRVSSAQAQSDGI